MMRFTIDPGHTKNWNKGIITGFFEGNMTFKLAKFLQAELEKYQGVEAVLTKQTLEENPTLKQRGNTAKNNKSDMFISLHSNAFSSSSANGVVGFYSLKNPSSKTFCNELCKCVAETMGIHNQGAKTKPYSSWQKNTDYYGVIRHSVGDTVKNSFLIEHGFHTNFKECQWLMKDENLQKLAVVEAQVIAQYYGLKLKQDKSSMFYVQIGAFNNRASAERLKNQAMEAGFDVCIKS